jgi:hypothetical protein
MNSIEMKLRLLLILFNFIIYYLLFIIYLLYNKKKGRNSACYLYVRNFEFSYQSLYTYINIFENKKHARQIWINNSKRNFFLYLFFTYVSVFIIMVHLIPQLSGALGYWKWQAEHLAIA